MPLTAKNGIGRELFSFIYFSHGEIFCKNPKKMKIFFVYNNLLVNSLHITIPDLI
jgi:hypothetical protein